MAENNAEEVIDTGLSDTTDTSTNDESDDTSLEDMEVSFDDIDTSEPEEESDESTDDTEEAAATDSEEEADDTSDDTSEESNDSDEELTDETASEADQAEVAHQAYKEREARKQEAKMAAQQEFLEGVNDVYETALQSGLSEDQARMEANRELAVRQLQIDAYNNRIEGNANKLVSSYNNAVQSIDMFQSGTPTQKEELLNAIDDFEAMHTTKDQNGDIVQVNGDLTAFLQKRADTIKRIAAESKQEQVKAKSKQQSRTVQTPNRAPKKAKSDPDLAAFDEVANSW